MYRDRFVFRTKDKEKIDALNLQEKGMLLDVVFAYHMGDKLPKMNPAVSVAFTFLKPQFDKDITTALRRRNAGMLGRGIPKRKVS